VTLKISTNWQQHGQLGTKKNGTKKPAQRRMALTNRRCKKA
jgi:hypothetical protein